MSDANILKAAALAVVCAWGAVLCLWCRKNGTPRMLSDIYYETGQSAVFGTALWTIACAMLPAMMETDGVKCLAFAACAGLLFVGAAPAYLSDSDSKIHKTAAITAAAAGTAWAISVAPWQTAAVGAAAVAVVVTEIDRWLLVLEVAAIVNVALALALN